MQTRIKRPPLRIITQADIDAPDLAPQDMTWRESLEYLDGIPGAVLTVVVLALFVAGCWAALLLWEMR